MLGWGQINIVLEDVRDEDRINGSASARVTRG